MSIKIGHASIDERGKISGGQVGDSTQKEVCTRSWYNNGWNLLLRPKTKELAEKSAHFVEEICANKNVGYDQSGRNSLYTQAKNIGFDGSRISVPCECDCSSFMHVSAIAGGANISYGSNGATTRTLRTVLGNSGYYDILTDSKYLTSDKYLKRGDILVKEGKHTVMVLENGIGIQNVNYTPSIIKGIDVSGYNKITDYQVVKNDGVQFAILKIIRKDLNLDKLFETHLKGFNKVGLPVIAVYNYSYATSVAKARSDASIVVKYLKQFNMPKSTVVYMDVEDNCQKGLGQLLIDMINVYQEVIEKAGYKFGLYTGLSFWNSHIKSYKSSLRCNVEWIARYKKGYSPMQFAENPEESSKPNIGTPIEGYQYTSSGIVNGIQGNVDLNILYNNSTFSSTPTIKNIVKVNITLNVRNKPNGTKIGSLKNGDEVEILDYKDNYFKIGTDKWVSADYIHNTYGVVTASTLNIRSGAGTSYTDIGDLKRNTNVRLLRESNGWYMILHDKKLGWVSSKYIDII